MQIEVGPASESDRDEILDGLNGSFGRWGGRQMYDWAFRRVVAGLAPDLLVVRESGRIIASTALMYRNAVSHTGVRRTAALIGGSWTAPDARRRGIFGAIVERAVDIARGRGAFIVGMGRHENASRQGFERHGFSILPSAYLRSTHATVAPEALESLEPQPSRFPAPAGVSRLDYAEDEWAGQFLNRPEPVDCVGRAGEWIALIERASGFDRLLALHASELHESHAIELLAAAAHAAGRRLFLFTADMSASARLERSGFEAIPGYLPLSADAAFSDWWLRHGDRA
jgi:GNAT superfamily N-acetyltransferase